MLLEDIIKNKNFNMITKNIKLINEEITGVYICDLLSFVLSKSKKGNVWITVHGHINIVAVAVVANLSCIIVVENVKVDEDTIEVAQRECIPIFTTRLNSFNAAKIFVEFFVI